MSQAGQPDSEQYEARKAFFDSLLTIFGRKPVLEALRDRDIKPYRLHLADSNKPTADLNTMTKLAGEKDVEIRYHSREALSRISKNRRQDQGVVLDIALPHYQPTNRLTPATHPELIAIENVTNPQNVGMIIRSVGASQAAGVIVPRQGCAPIDALVIKASAGTVFKSPIFHCPSLLEEITDLKAAGYRIVGLAGGGRCTLPELSEGPASIFVLGNETEGLSPAMAKLCDELVSIPMNNGVESLNVSVAAAVVAFRSLYR